MAVYLRGYPLLPSARTSELFRDIFQAAVSEGTLDTILRESAQNLAAFMDDLKKKMIAAPVAHFDETGLSVNGKNHGLHSVSTKEAAYYAMHPKRGTEAMIDCLLKIKEKVGQAKEQGQVSLSELKQKISGTFRSSSMADAFCRIRSFISTVRKQGLQLRDAIESVFSSSPLMPLALSKT
jgi:hypothetical protein